MSNIFQVLAGLGKVISDVGQCRGGTRPAVLPRVPLWHPPPAESGTRSASRRAAFAGAGIGDDTVALNILIDLGVRDSPLYQLGALLNEAANAAFTTGTVPLSTGGSAPDPYSLGRLSGTARYPCHHRVERQDGQ